MGKTSCAKKIGGHIYCIVGKSGSGKDTLLRAILEQYTDRFSRVIEYTTRPKRAGEIDGQDYWFVTPSECMRREMQGKILDLRRYEATEGTWLYFHCVFQVVNDRDIILITTLDGAKEIERRYGTERVRVIYLMLDDETRIMRCIGREKHQNTPNFTEMCRRYVADQKDFDASRFASIHNLHVIDASYPVCECVNDFIDIVNDDYAGSERNYTTAKSVDAC